MVVSVHRLLVETGMAVCVHGRDQQSRSRCTQLESSRVQSREHVTGGRARKSEATVTIQRDRSIAAPDQ
jgi:hypothetical protein